MADILHAFVIQAPADRVFAAFATPAGLRQWWAAGATGVPALGEVYELDFGPAHQWRARVVECARPRRLEWEMVTSDADWNGTRVGFELSEQDGTTQVRFWHTGWPHANQHFRISTYCWAMYLRILRRYVEHGETVPYERRLDA